MVVLRDILPVMEGAMGLFLQIGNKYNINSLGTINDGILKLYNIVKDQPKRDRIDQISEIEDSDRYMMLLQNLLTDAEKEIKKYGEKNTFVGQN